MTAALKLISNALYIFQKNKYLVTNYGDKKNFVSEFMPKETEITIEVCEIKKDFYFKKAIG
jgi:hypothetical protein